MDKLFPTCKILGVDVAVCNMDAVADMLTANIRNLSGQYICVSNSHTLVMASEDSEYLKVQNGACVVLPDGKPLSVISQKRGFAEAKRVAGPDLMEEMFVRGQAGNGLSHFFYGSDEETLCKLRNELETKYPNMKIAGMYAPPFRPLTAEEENEVQVMLTNASPDIIWIGLGAPKQELFMASHAGMYPSVMIGVGAGFAFHAKVTKRAPKWMQKIGLEWLYRLSQDPKRLFKRYLITNTKFIIRTIREAHK